MSVEEREYMGQPADAATPPKAVDLVPTTEAIDERDAEIKLLRQQLSKANEDHRKATQQLEQSQKELAEASSLLETAIADGQAWAVLLAKSKRLVQRQGEALIADHYGPSKFQLLIVARALLSIAESPNEEWRQCVVNWFDDYEREMRGLACEPMRENKPA